MDQDERKEVEAALDRLREKKEFTCIKCATWIASVGDGLHDTCTKQWKTFEEYGLCYECFTKEKDLDVAREKFQRSMDEFWDEVKDDLNETRSGGDL